MPFPVLFILLVVSTVVVIIALLDSNTPNPSIPKTARIISGLVFLILLGWMLATSFPERKVLKKEELRRNNAVSDSANANACIISDVHYVFSG